MLVLSCVIYDTFITGKYATSFYCKVCTQVVSTDVAYFGAVGLYVLEVLSCKCSSLKHDDVRQYAEMSVILAGLHRVSKKKHPLILLAIS